MGRPVFLDLYGVLVDSAVMERRYNERMAAILHARHGGSLARWREVQAASYEWYVAEGEKLDARPGPTREGAGWVEEIRGLNGRQVAWVLERLGVPPPEDAVTYAESIEAETVRGIDAFYEDARPALSALRAAGHRLFLSTNANRSNAESALVGGGVRDLFEGLAMLETAMAKKDRASYWRRAFRLARVAPAEAVVVDDIARYLAPAAALGATCIQIVRPHLRRDPGPFPIVRSLAAVPDLVADA